MAAETLARAGIAVTVYDRMPSVGRKLLMAGRGGLNLTHSEPLAALVSRYGSAVWWLGPIIAEFPPQALIDWVQGLGQPTFTGSSARVFPVAMKASPLLRAWLRRLTEQAVSICPRHRWGGWETDGSLRFDAESGVVRARPDVTVLALGGASWPRLGSDAGWTDYLPDVLVPFQPANCGFAVAWSQHFCAHFAGRPVKRLAVRFGSEVIRGEAVITETGLEGGVIYGLSARLRNAVQQEGSATIHLDLRPDLSEAVLANRLGGPRGSQSLANTLRKRAGLSAEAIGLLQEALHGGAAADDLPRLIKSLPIRLLRPAPIERAISSAGGLRADAMDRCLMLRDRPGVFAAG